MSWIYAGLNNFDRNEDATDEIKRARDIPSGSILTTIYNVATLVVGCT